MSTILYTALFLCAQTGAPQPLSVGDQTSSDTEVEATTSATEVTPPEVEAADPGVDTSAPEPVATNPEIDATASVTKTAGQSTQALIDEAKETNPPLAEGDYIDRDLLFWTTAANAAASSVALSLIPAIAYGLTARESSDASGAGLDPWAVFGIQVGVGSILLFLIDDLFWMLQDPQEMVESPGLVPWISGLWSFVVAPGLVGGLTYLLGETLGQRQGDIAWTLGASYSVLLVPIVVIPISIGAAILIPNLLSEDEPEEPGEKSIDNIPSA